MNLNFSGMFKILLIQCLLTMIIAISFEYDSDSNNRNTAVVAIEYASN